ncbi:peptidoglycan DD-metalloendopeptidase family protein (plasmid) [Alkalihalobacillus hwajinpoensis]|uniref:murein hydrolase activator EnvC family protein n=1 Tax=Guptibacillus hwajinpoensis TaxID=208199 RepID=UPI0018840702|nr:M23 family metallopeptidase [Pseudalkalibacillus hwajinpoensis]MBF0706691.1 peptidoglycan DD-metalloendopeptidase family protein [Pseudalkalibacillus hwajinpoensis]
MRRIFTLLGITILIVGASPPGFTYASENKIEKKINQIQKDKDKTKTTTEEKQDELQKNQSEQMTIETQIKRLDEDITQASEEIENKQDEIKDNKDAIATLKLEVNKVEERIEERNTLLKGRVRSIYQKGGSIQYIDVLLGAENFGNLVQRFVTLSTIAEHDKTIIEEHEADLKLLEQQKKEMQRMSKLLENQLVALEEAKDALNSKIEEKNRLMNSLQEQEEQISNEITDLREIESNLNAQEDALRLELKKQQEREAAARKKAEEEATRERAEKEAAKEDVEKEVEEEQPKTMQKPVSNATSNSGENNDNSSNENHSPQKEGSTNDEKTAEALVKKSESGFMMPTAGRLTSTIGERWNKFHAGIDIAKSGIVPVVASAAGTVSRSYYSTSYGNVVFITHYINGQQYTTVYAHMRDRTVSTGQSVSQGQQVGNQGNTGNSFGQHLHFELHKGAWNSSKSNAVNPLSYIN